MFGSFENNNKCCMCGKDCGDEIENVFFIHKDTGHISGCEYSCEQLLWKILRKIIEDNKNIDLKNLIEVFKKSNLRNIVESEKLVSKEGLLEFTIRDRLTIEKHLNGYIDYLIEDERIIASPNGVLGAQENEKIDPLVQRENEKRQKLEHLRNDASKLAEYQKMMRPEQPKKIIIEEKPKASGMQYVNRDVKKK